MAETSKKVEAALESPAFTSPEGREALDAERALIEIRTTLAKAQRAAKEAERRLSPVSILVSKKDNRVYVRQGLAPVMEAPATIRDPETPLGTHIYIATSRNDDLSLGWSVVTLPQSAKGAERSPHAFLSRPSAGARRTPGRRFDTHFRAIVDRRLPHYFRPGPERRNERCWHRPRRHGAVTPLRARSRRSVINQQTVQRHSLTPPTRVERLQQETGEPLLVRICKCCLSTNDVLNRVRCGKCSVPGLSIR